MRGPFGALSARKGPLTAVRLRGRLALGTWQSICLVDTNGDNPTRRVRFSYLTG